MKDTPRQPMTRVDDAEITALAEMWAGDDFQPNVHAALLRELLALRALVRDVAAYLHPVPFLDYQDGTPMDSCQTCPAEALADQPLPHVEDCIYRRAVAWAREEGQG